MLGILSDTLVSLLLYFLWRAAVDVSFRHPPGPASAAIATIVLSFLWLYGRRNGPRGPGAGERCVPRRIRWAMVGSIVASWMVVKCTLFVLWDLPPSPSAIETGSYLRAYLGWLPVLMASTIAIPLIEETFLRGFIQRRLMSVVGVGTAICLTTGLTGLIHRESPGLPLILAGALVTGPMVAWGGSIWAGVLVHSAGNVALGLYAVVSSGTTRSSAGPSAVGVALLTLSCWAILTLWLSVQARGSAYGTGNRTGAVAKASLRLDCEREGLRR